METKRKALGKGLEQLFSNEKIDFDNFENKIVQETKESDIVEIPLTEIRSNPYQPREHFDEQALREFADSIKEHGVIQPIIVKKSIKGYEIIAGERRYRASKLAGKTTIPAIIRDFTDEQMMEIALLENLQRENLSVIEEAIAYQKMLTSLKLTQEELALKVGKSRSHVTNILGLLRLPENVQRMILNHELTMGHARVLSKLEDSEKIREIATKIVEDNLTVRATEELLEAPTFTRVNKIKRHDEKNNDFKYVEDIMRAKLDTKVRVKDHKVIISFTNTADLNRILAVLDVKGD